MRGKTGTQPRENEALRSIGSFFSVYASATAAALANQTVFFRDNPEKRDTGIAFARISAGGTKKISLLFSNVLEGTFAGGEISRANDVIAGYALEDLSLAVVKECTPEAAEAAKAVPLFFGGKAKKEFSDQPEAVLTDEVTLELSAGEFFALTFRFSGKCVPCHKESVLLLCKNEGAGYYGTTEIPLPLAIGVREEGAVRLGFLGDSITQGCGTTRNGYANYAARLSERLGERVACYNLGIGYGRAADLATDGIWMALGQAQNAATLCYGVNDLLRGYGADAIKKNLSHAVRALKGAGVKVLIQTVPPFDYNEETTARWREVNRYIREELSHECDGFFDTVPHLSVGDDDPRAKYGGHPSDQGHAVWASALLPVIEAFLG